MTANDNAATIVSIGKSRGESAVKIQIALMTAITESGLLMYANSNIPDSLRYPHDAVGSDHDSLGIFQQQTPGWGSVAQLMDATYDTTKFFDALDGKYNAGLSPWLNAQKVQISAFSDGSNYQKNWAQAQSLYSSTTGTPATTVNNVDTASVSVSSVWGVLSQSSTWLRIGLGAAGAALLLFAVIKILTTTNAGKTALNSAKKVTHAGS